MHALPSGPVTVIVQVPVSALAKISSTPLSLRPHAERVLAVAFGEPGDDQGALIAGRLRLRLGRHRRGKANRDQNGADDPHHRPPRE